MGHDTQKTPAKSVDKSPKSKPKTDDNAPVKEGTGIGPLIGGKGILDMLKSIIPMLGGDTDDQPECSSHCVENPLELLGDNDLDGGDETIKHFKNKGGMNGVLRVIKIHGPNAIEHIAALIDELTEVRRASRLQLLRNTFSDIHAAMKGSGARQAQAVNTLKRLSADSTSLEEYNMLAKASEAVLRGETQFLDTAAVRVRGVFASYVPQTQDNVRLAYTSLSTQDGEGYLRCPKSLHNGYSVAVPMEQSKCRDNCIDSRTTRDGIVTCAYKNWLKVVADNQNSANSRLEVQRHPDNQANLLTLKAGDRSHAEHDKADFDTYERKIEEDYKVKTPRKVTMDENTPMDDRLRNKGNGLVPGVPQEKQDKEHQKLFNDTETRSSGITFTDGKNWYKLATPKWDCDKSYPHHMDAEKEETMEEQIDKGTDREIPKTTIEKRLETGLYGHQGDPKSRPQGKKLISSVGEDKIDPKSQDTLGTQIEKGNGHWKYDKTIEEMLGDEDTERWTDEEYNTLIEELISDKRENKE